MYIREAHAQNEWQMQDNVAQGIIVDQPKTTQDRHDLARRCCQSMKLTMPCVVDDMSNSVDQAYAAWPERIFVIEPDGRLGYAGARGPWGFKPAEAQRYLRRTLR